MTINAKRSCKRASGVSISAFRGPAALRKHCFSQITCNDSQLRCQRGMLCLLSSASAQLSHAELLTFVSLVG